MFPIYCRKIKVSELIFFFTKYKEYKYPELEMFFSRIVESVYYYNGPQEEKYIVIVLAVVSQI